MPRRRSLTQEQLAAAALAVIDRDGLAGLSMRAVAQELRMSTMALYRYVDDRDELERLVVDHVFQTMEVRAPTEGTWEQRVEEMVLRARGTARAHPDAVTLTLSHRHHCPAILCWADTVLTILTEAGFDGEERVIALRCLLAYIIGATQLEQLGPLSGAGTAAMSALPPTDFPHLAETAQQALSVDPDAEFRGGLAILLRGLGRPG
jgi:AcrR family transcriptional regulator